MEIISPKQPIKAKKDYPCDACECLFYYGKNDKGGQQVAVELGLDKREIRAMRAAIESGFIIKKGEVCIEQVNSQDGFVWIFRAIPAIHEICEKYKIY